MLLHNLAWYKKSHFKQYHHKEIKQIDQGHFQCSTSKKYLRIDEATEKEIKGCIKCNSLMSMQTKDFKAHIKFNNIYGEIDSKMWSDIYILPWNYNIDNFTRY